MKKRVAIYGGTELSAEESWFVESLTYGLLKNEDVVVVSGGFLYWPEKMPGAVSTDFSVLQGAKRYASEQGLPLESLFETWLPDPLFENDPDKKTVVRFKEGKVKELNGESARARRFSMIRDVDLLITVKGSKHTSMVLDFAVTMNKPAFPLAFTGGDSRDFWKVNRSRIQKQFNLNDEFVTEMESKDIREDLSPGKKAKMQDEIIVAIKRGLETETRNQEYYRRVQDELKETPQLDIEQQGSSSTRENVKKQLKIFVSYAHKDVELKDELDVSLIALKRDERISIWQDTDSIRGGDQWNEKIQEGLMKADIILLLISPNFIASEYIWQNELPVAKQRYEDGLTKVIPIFLRDVFAENMWFTKLQGYISLDKPIAAFKDYDRDTALKKVVQGISNDINNWLSLT